MRRAPFVVLLLAAACGRPVAPPVGIDGDPCVAARARLAASACLEERFAPSFLAVCHTAAARGLLDPACIATAADPRECLGGPRCP